MLIHEQTHSILMIKLLLWDISNEKQGFFSLCVTDHCCDSNLASPKRVFKVDGYFCQHNKYQIKNCQLHH